MPHDSLTGCDALVWIDDRVSLTTGRAPGQVVVIKDCPHPGWGKQEQPTGTYRFKVLHFPDKRKADLQHLLKPHEEYYANTAEENMFSFPLQRKAMVRRRWRINLDALPSFDLSEITTNAQRYHSLNGDTALGVLLDDKSHPQLRSVFEREDRTEALNLQHAAVQIGLRPMPPGYVPTDRDISAAIYELDLRVARGEIKTPPTYIPPHARGGG